jgi:hypothetical protein
VLQILMIVCGVGSLICWILMLVKIFQAGYTVPGILGIFCGLVAYIYGWMKADELDAKPIMLGWTGCIVGQIIFAVMAASSRGALQ